MRILGRLWALVLILLGLIMLTVGLPISGLWWILSGDFFPWLLWGAAEEYT